MQKHPRLTEDRIRLMIERVKGLIYSSPVPLRVEAFHVGGEPIRAEEAFKGHFQPFAIGGAWGPAWDTAWFRFTGTVPESWRGREVCALVNLGGSGSEGFTAEGQVWMGGLPTRALNVNRSDVPLLERAKGGEAVSFYVEAAANPKALNVAGKAAESKVPLFTLSQAEMVCVNREVYDFFHDLRVAYETMMVLPADQPRRGQMLQALNAAVAAFDETNLSSISAARRFVREMLSRRNGDTTHHISALGHAHIDTAWLWPLRETIRKCARTFSTVLAYMEQHPEFVFACSQAQQYAWMKEFYPSIYKGIKRAIRKGQWEPVGSAWVEPDCNISSGESLIRQFLLGKNFFQEEFGIETTDFWIPDSFGFSAALPQILRKAGVKYFMTQKMSWNQFNKFPHHTFLWEGLDGSRVFAHFPPAETYNGRFTPKELAFNVSNFKEHDRASRSLYLYGFGDGGGGPTREMLETARRVKDLEGLPRVELERLAHFFPRAERDAKDPAVWSGELYLELHRGVYTSQAETKKQNRKCEILLHDAEFLSVVAGDRVSPRLPQGPRAVYDVFGKGEPSVAAHLDRAWKLLLLNQFHDILPGSSIGWVYKDSARDYAMVTELCESVIEPARQSLAASIDTNGMARPYVVFNSAGFERETVVSLPGGAPVHVKVPACGYTVIDGAEQKPISSFAAPVEVGPREKGFVLDNGMIRVWIDKLGFVTGIHDYRANREVLAPGQRGNVFQLHPDQPNNWGAWDIDIFYRETCQEIGGLETMEIVENTPLRATVRIVRSFGKSKIVQRISLRAGSARLDFDTEVDWQERLKLLKVAFPVNVRSPRATYEVQFGHVERPTHQNTSWDMARFEVCAQKWADLSEADFGVALLNDCKYGYDILGNVMRLSLLRAPENPDPAADRGKHRFVYALLPHWGDFRAGEVVRAGYDLNMPLHVVPTDNHAGTEPKTRSFFEVDHPGIIIESIKRAEKENAVIVRLYEAHGGRGTAMLKTSLPIKQAYLADLMECNLDRFDIANRGISFEFTPFEIVTLKLTLA